MRRNIILVPGDILRFMIELKPDIDLSNYPNGFNVDAVTSRKYEIVINII